MKYIIGSKLLNLDNTRDVDYLILTNNKNEYSKTITTDGEICYMSMDVLNNNLSFRNKHNIYQVFNYQYDYRIIKQNFPIKYDILSYRKDLYDFIDWCIKKQHLCFNTTFRVNKYYCSKFIYHIAYNIFILKNNDILLTSDQQNIIQKIHDNKMPIEYLYELKNIFYTIKQN